MSEITRYNTTSLFPDAVDDLLCVSDINLEQLPIANLHAQYLSQDRYTDAGALLESEDLDSLCASLFNLIENRIYPTQVHLDGKHSKWYEIYGVESPIEHFDMPTNTVQKPVWGNIEDLSKLSIGNLSGGYRLSNAGGFRP